MQNPLVQTALLPLLVTAAAAVALRLAGGPGRGPLLVGAAIGIGFLVAYAVITGMPPFPPRSSSHKLAYIVLLGLILGIAWSLLRIPRATNIITIFVATAACVAWLAQPKLRAAELTTLLPVAILWATGALAMLRLSATRSDTPDGAMMLVLAAVGMAAVAIFGRSASMTQFAGALAAAAGGFVLCAWFMPSFRLGQAGTYGGGIALLSIATVLVLYTKSSPLALAVLILVFFLDSVVDRLPATSGALGRILRPVWMGALALMPVGAAAGIAYLMSSGSAGGGY